LKNQTDIANRLRVRRLRFCYVLIAVMLLILLCYEFNSYFDSL
jgi:hypothetical protein